jgi:hypothetical protein
VRTTHTYRVAYASAAASSVETESADLDNSAAYKSLPLPTSSPLIVTTTRRRQRRLPLPEIYPVHSRLDQSSQYGVGFAVAPGVVITCEHCASSDVSVAGSPAFVRAACAADVAILHIPALMNGDDDATFPASESILEAASAIEVGHRVRIVNASRNSVYARVVGMPSILYSSSGAVLPSLLLEVERCAISQGWSGSPVMCAESGIVLGMVAHGTTVFDYADDNPSAADGHGAFIHAVPGALLHWLYNKVINDCYSLTGKPHWYGIGAIVPLTVQPLRDAIAWKAVEACLLQSSTPTAALAASALRRGGIRGARVVHAASIGAAGDCGLQTGDIIMGVNGFDVDWDGCIQWHHGLSTGLQAAFIGLEPNATSEVTVVRAGGDGERLDLVLTLGAAERSALGVNVKSRGVAVDCGNGVVRLVEVSVQRLKQWFGDGWERDCGGELSEIARGSHSDDGNWKEHVIVDAQWLAGQEAIYQANGPECVPGTRSACSDISEWARMGGMLIAKMDGQEVRSLEDAVSIASRSQRRFNEASARLKDNDESCAVVVEMRNGYIALLPQPMRLVHEDSGEEVE